MRAAAVAEGALAAVTEVENVVAAVTGVGEIAVLAEIAAEVASGEAEIAGREGEHYRLG